MFYNLLFLGSTNLNDCNIEQVTCSATMEPGDSDDQEDTATFTPGFVEEGTYYENLSFDDDLPFNSVELNLEEGMGLENSTNIGDHPLYINAPISVAESLLLIMTFANRHKITGKAHSDLLT